MRVLVVFTDASDLHCGDRATQAPQLRYIFFLRGTDAVHMMHGLLGARYCCD